jgi:uncharacterized protein (TIGR00369 family)
MTPAEINVFLDDVYHSAYVAGFRCEEMGEGWAKARWIYQRDRLRAGDYIPGPIQFWLADLALWFAIFTIVGISPMAVTSDLAITFLRPGVGGDLVARAELLQVGKTRIYGDVRLWVDGAEDRLISHATGSYAGDINRRISRETPVGS